MNNCSDCNKLAYADKIIKEETNETENENLRKYFEQKLIQAYKENDELKRKLVEKEEIIKEQKIKLKERTNELKEKEETEKELLKEINQQKLNASEMQEVIKSQKEIIEEKEEKIKEQDAKIEKAKFIINIYHKEHFLEIKNFFMKEGRRDGVNALEQIEKYNGDHN
jgi:hypothetical protein